MIVAIRHHWCGSVSVLPPGIGEHLDRGTWDGGLDCVLCRVYVPLADFDLLDGGWDEPQGDADHDSPDGDGESGLRRVAAVPSSRRRRNDETHPRAAR